MVLFLQEHLSFERLGSMSSPDQCYICAAQLSPSLAKCTKCGVEVSWLQAVPAQVRKSRFLFGQVQQPELEPSQKVAHVAKAKPRVRKRKAPEPKPAEPIAQVVEVKKPDIADIIRNRDAEFARLEEQAGGRPQWQYLMVLAIDSLICIMCGLIMVFGAQLLTERNLEQLFTYSLMPLAFAFMSFAFLYFCLFWMLLQQTPGMLMLGYEKEEEHR